MKRSALLCLMVATSATACSSSESNRGLLTIRTDLSGPEGSFEVCADFEVSGPTTPLLSSWPAVTNEPCTSPSASVPFGRYSVRLLDGWQIRRVGGAPVVVNGARLVFGATRSVEVEDAEPIEIAFRFAVGGVELGTPGGADGSDGGVDAADSGPSRDPDAGARAVDAGLNPGLDGGTSSAPDAGPNPGLDGGTSSAPDAGPNPGLDGGSTEPPVCEVLAPTCEPNYYADGECDPANNFAACSWDQGDCCPSTCVSGEAADCGAFGYDCRDPAAGGRGETPPPPLAGTCEPVSNPFDPIRMGAEVTLLASDALGGRSPGSTGDIQTRAYIEARLSCMGLSAGVQGCFQQPFANEDDMDPTANVIGVIAGQDPTLSNEIIVVGGHHDHLGWIDSEVYNGANDNASGIVAMLAIAQAMQNSASAPRRTVVFVAFGSEESGLEGAIHFVNNPPVGMSMDDIVYMVNLDMLGTYDVSGRVDAFGTHVGTVGRELLDVILGSHPDLDVRLGLTAPAEDSDFDPFCQLGIPHVYFETPDPQCLHEACDDPDRIDLPHFAELSTILHSVVVGLANTSADLRTARATLGCPR